MAVTSFDYHSSSSLAIQAWSAEHGWPDLYNLLPEHQLMPNYLLVLRIAEICHEANRAYCQWLGDHSQLPWETAPDWQKNSVLAGVAFCIANPEAPASANHESWLAHKIAEGWSFGPVKDAVAKTHPCLVPYDQLPPEQQTKDRLFKSIVDALTA